MHYVIGDVHGCFDELQALINKIESEDSDAQFFFVGDFIDRGPKILETLEWCMKNITDTGKYQSVLGNHEDIFLNELTEIEKVCAIKNIDLSKVRINSYFGLLPTLVKVISKDKSEVFVEDLKPVKDFFNSLPIEIKIDVTSKWGKQVTYRLVHSHYDFGKKEQDREDVLWFRDHHGYPDADEIVIHGHTPTIVFDYRMQDLENSVPGMISYRMNDINVDGGCVFAKDFNVFPCFLCAIRLEDLEEIYAYSIEERFKQINVGVSDEELESVVSRFYKECIKVHPLREELLKKLINGGQTP